MSSNGNTSNRGSRTSLLIGAPLGLLAMALFFFGCILLLAMLTGEGLPGMGFYFRFRIPILCMAITLIPTLWFTGRFAENCLLKNQAVWLVSLKYSALTSVCAWSGFVLADCILSFSDIDLFSTVVLPLVLCGLTITGATVSIGLLICFRIRKKIRPA